MEWTSKNSADYCPWKCHTTKDLWIPMKFARHQQISLFTQVLQIQLANLVNQELSTGSIAKATKCKHIVQVVQEDPNSHDTSGRPIETSLWEVKGTLDSGHWGSWGPSKQVLFKNWESLDSGQGVGKIQVTRLLDTVPPHPKNKDPCYTRTNFPEQQTAQVEGPLWPGRWEKEPGDSETLSESFSPRQTVHPEFEATSSFSRYRSHISGRLFSMNSVNWLANAWAQSIIWCMLYKLTTSVRLMGRRVSIFSVGVKFCRGKQFEWHNVSRI